MAGRGTVACRVLQALHSLCADHAVCAVCSHTYDIWLCSPAQHSDTEPELKVYRHSHRYTLPDTNAPHFAQPHQTIVFGSSESSLTLQTEVRRRSEQCHSKFQTGKPNILVSRHQPRPKHYHAAHKQALATTKREHDARKPRILSGGSELSEQKQQQHVRTCRAWHVNQQHETSCHGTSS